MKNPWVKKLELFVETNPCWDEWTSDMLIAITILNGFTLIGVGGRIWPTDTFIVRLVVLNYCIGIWYDPEK